MQGVYVKGSTGGNPFTRLRRRRRGDDTTSTARGRGSLAGGADADEDQVIDLTDGAWGGGDVDADRREAEAAERAERLRRWLARADAESELQRLRARHWSGERLIEEARTEHEWWQHPDADPYAVLGLMPGASLEEAAAARRKVAHECHPDRVDLDTAAGQEALDRMVAANAAYERLRRAMNPH